MQKNRHFHDFAEFRDHVLSTFLSYYPTLGSWLGLHQYDHIVEDFSPARRAQYLTTLREAQDWLDVHHAIDKADETTNFECRVLSWKIADEIFRLTELKDFEWSPMVYNEQLEIMHLVDRDFAPLRERMRAVLTRLEAYPRVLAIARQNLSAYLDRTIVETGLEAMEGRLSYLDQLPDIIFPELNDAHLQAELTQAIQTAKLSIASFADAVRTVVLPMSMYDSFRLGEGLMERFLKSSELVEESLDELVEKGQREMDKLTVEMYKVSSELDANANPREVFHTFVESEHFSETTIIREVESMLERIRKFVIDQHLVSIPSEVRCRVQETPAHMRWAFAAMNSPGAFERVATEAYYYVTLPEPTWEAEKRKEFLHTLNRSVLEIVSIHEAYPGHYVHFLHLPNIASKVGKIFQSYGFIEGWAHYTEEMMLEAGWGEGDPRMRMAYLQEALIRLCRFMVSLGIHRGKMTLSEGQALFEEKALMRPVAARREAERGVFDPGYMLYTLGKFQIRELREKAQKQSNFSLYDFHNDLLSYGSVPIKIIAEMMGV
jgi:uncharacterized protein (DUF885 family)